MDLYTIQMAKHRLAKSKDIELLDTTVKSGKYAFAPTWEMVLGYKDGSISEEVYTRLYRDRMLQMMRNHKDDWIELIQTKQPVAIACYCQAGKFCHRHLLVDILKQVCIRKGIPFHYHGEIT